MTEEMHVNWGAEHLASERTLSAAEAVYSSSEPRAQARDAQVQDYDWSQDCLPKCGRCKPASQDPAPDAYKDLSDR